MLMMCIVDDLILQQYGINTEIISSQYLNAFIEKGHKEATKFWKTRKVTG